MHTAPAWIEATVAVITGLGILAVLGRGAWNRATNADLRSRNADLRDENADFRARISDLETAMDALKRQVETLTEANRVLTNTITAADKIDALARRVDENHRETLSAIRGEK